jgi:hypothetical protein
VVKGTFILPPLVFPGWGYERQVADGGDLLSPEIVLDFRHPPLELRLEGVLRVVHRRRLLADD